MEILTGAAGSIVSEIVKYTAKPIVRHIGYSFCYKKITGGLTEEKVRLEQRKQVIHDTIDPGIRNNTEVANTAVRGWLINVDQIIEEVQTLENQIQVNKMCCKGWSTKKTTNAAKLLQEAAGWDLKPLIHRAPLPDIVIFSSNDDCEVFKSRKLIFEELLEALRDDNCKRIGLHGLGGVGKTTLVMDVCKKAKDLFSDIVKTTVSQTPDIRKIQDEIAECLNLKLDEEKTEGGRARRIWLRIKQAEKKILIILDDVWKDVKLGDIGIPSGEDQEKFKILLTTRREHVCDLLHCSKKILLEFLSNEESLALIKKTASIVDDYRALNDVVLQVVEECKGLPIAIVTVGKALIRKSLTDWEVALRDLKNSRYVEICDVDEDNNAYVCLKWSYDHLNRKTKLCFLMCSLFPEDYDISIEELSRYAMGLEEYQDVNSLDEVRSQVHVAINHMRESALLLESDHGEEYVKMHDMVRDVALWIASKGENEFKLIAYTHLAKNMNFERVTTISLMASNTKQLPDKLVCPSLNILLLGRIEGSKKISNTFFEGLNCLKVLRLEDKILSSHSLQFLTNLQSLHLKDCDFSDNLSSLGKLKRLEILSFQGLGMVALPNEFGEMESLRLLDLRGCYKLKQIPQNVIQRLSRLEELIMNEYSFKNWDVEGTSNANLSELNSLPYLVFLSLSLELKYLPQGFVFPSLQRYHICVNSSDHFFWEDNRTKCFDLRVLVIKELNFFSMNAFKVLFRTVEYIQIESCEMECIVDTTSRGDHTVMFANLIKLHLMYMSCLRTICEGPNHYVIFSNLTDFVADGCTRLVSLFSPSVAQSLKKLKNLRLVHCNELKQIISEDEGMILESHSQPICLPELQTIYVKYCPKLEYIFPLLVARDLPQLESLELEDLPQLKQVFDHEKEGDVRDGNNASVWPSLKEVKVENCPKMKWSFFADLEANVPAHGKVILYFFWFLHFLDKTYASAVFEILNKSEY
ncbi:probable disease resistance protein At4g27220 [Fagus crenata]